MLVLPLFPVFAAVVAVHASAHDTARNLSHSRRSQSMRQARDARYKARADAARGLLDGILDSDPFSLPSDDGAGSSTAASSSSSSADDGSSNSASQSISLPDATSTDLGSSSAATPTDSGSTSATATDSVSASGSITDAPPSSSAAASSSATEGGGGGILSSILSGILDPPTDSESATTSAAATSSAAQSSSTTESGGGGILSSILSGVLDPPTESASATTSESIIFSSTAIFSPSVTITEPPPSSAPTSSESSSTGIGISLPFSISIPISIPISDDPTPPSSVPVSVPPSSVPVSDTPTPPSSVPVSDSPPSSVPVSDSVTPSSGIISSSSIIDFPSGSSSSVSASDSGPSSVTSQSVTPSVTPSVPADLTFILTESSLALGSAAATTTLSVSDPDAPTTTISFTATAQTALTTAPLPTDLPMRIYPPSGAISDPGTDYAFVSLLYDNFLGWKFVCTNSVSSTQIFALMPLILATALNTPVETIKTFGLQVRAPDSYTGVDDADKLQTMFLAWIPKDLVDPLALQLKARNSLFYNGMEGNPVATELATHIVSAFALNSVAAPKTGGSGSGSDSDSSTNELSSSSSSSKTRQDAIIGVVTALGAIALIVLLFLAYRAFKRRAELAHRRLSDAPDVGIPPTGRDFDQDSVGGQRRRSFYFAEDSLRGFGSEAASDGAYSPQPGQQGMTQRRNVMPAAISAPILQQSSMNW
ncbi:hypothetical protein MKEN_01389000 [Mycena kentingensis (nom. inval.)]|nr:hypothetical protein MKEN_01389000 [Mycena kentingensis (nom. inval.)]